RRRGLRGRTDRTRHEDDDRRERCPAHSAVIIELRGAGAQYRALRVLVHRKSRNFTDDVAPCAGGTQVIGRWLTGLKKRPAPDDTAGEDKPDQKVDRRRSPRIGQYFDCTW